MFEYTVLLFTDRKSNDRCRKKYDIASNALLLNFDYICDKYFSNKVH